VARPSNGSVSYIHPNTMSIDTPMATATLVRSAVDRPAVATRPRTALISQLKTS
jgi:hypothetical protein